MNSTVGMKLARRCHIAVIVRSSLIVEMSGLESARELMCPFVLTPKEPLDIRIICLPMKAIIPSKLVGSPRIPRSHAHKRPVTNVSSWH